MAGGRTAGWNVSRRIRVAGLLLAGGLAAGMLVSWKLWLGSRDFPYLPCFRWLGPWPKPWDGLLLGAMGVSLLAWALQPRWRGSLAICLGCALLLAMQDQVRWQPWYYFYLLGLAGFLVPGVFWRPERDLGLLGYWRLLLVCLYFWSGYHKLGPGFHRVHEVAVEEPVAELWGQAAGKALGHLGPSVPWIEMLIAVFLLLPWTRKAGVVMAIGTHGWVLLVMGPLGSGENEVVWPWNLCAALLVAVVFWKAPAFGWRVMFAGPWRYASVALAILAGIMPAFSPGRWDRYLSFHLYAGKDQRIMLVVDKRAAVAIPPRYRRHLVPSEVNAHLLELRFKDWTLEELKVPFPGEERMNLALAKKLAALPFPPGATVFFYYDYEFQLEQRGWDRFSPREMLAIETLPEPRRTYRPRSQ